MGVHLFRVRRQVIASSATAKAAPKGRGPLLLGRVPLPAPRWLLPCVTKDGTGTPLPGCVVDLFRTADDVKVDSMTSDAAGACVFSVSRPTAYYAAAVDPTGLLAGVTLGNLVGVDG